MSNNAIMLIFGGLAFFMYGMRLASDQLQQLAANKIGALFRQVSQKSYLSILVGILITALLQSSGAFTSMLVGLGTAEVVTLRQVMGLIVGTAIGTTVTVQIVSFDIAKYGLPMFILGFTYFFISKKRVPKSIAGIVIGFGLLFLGMDLMAQGANVLKQYDFITEAFVHLKENPFLTMVLGVLISAFCQSSNVTIVLAMNFAASGIISFREALFIIYGANIGTTATALIASIGSNYVGRQVAWAHFFYKVIPFGLYYLISDPIILKYMPTSDSISRDIANAHTILNVISSIMFYPFIDIGAKWIERLFPKSASDKEFGPRYLNLETYEHKELAFAQARREALRMGDIVTSMIKDSIDLFKSEDPEMVESIRKRDNQVDTLQKEIKLFLTKLSSPELGELVLNLITYVSDLEGVGDVIDNSILELARKKHALKLEFSAEGWREIHEMHSLVMEIASLSSTCFHLQDPELAGKAIDKKRELRKTERHFKESHIDRLAQGLQESINTSSIHMDLLGDYRRIVGLLVNHAYVISKKGK